MKNETSERLTEWTIRLYRGEIRRGQLPKRSPDDSVLRRAQNKWTDLAKPLTTSGFDSL